MVSSPRKSIAIIGSGISGIATAYLLKQSYDVTLIEKNGTFGGHSHTVDMTVNGVTFPVDTGFIVFNPQTYPHLVSFFQTLGIESYKSDMSFGVFLEGGGIEYCGSSLNQFFAQRKNIFNSKFWRMGLDILAFNKAALCFDLATLSGISLDAYVDSLNLSDVFKEWYFYPMAGAIWSTPTKDIGDFPAATLIQFFRNHGLLSATQHPQWYTVRGGSRSYVEKALSDPAIRKHLNTQVLEVRREGDAVHVVMQDTGGHPERSRSERFDGVVFATPAPETLSMIHPTDQEQKLLSCFAYSANRAYLHRDPSLMPRNRKAWASWNYFKTKGNGVGVTYWMNLLQDLPCSEPVLLTLNPETVPDPLLTHGVYDYNHPLFTDQAIAAQQALPTLQGHLNSWFCGSYHRYGFHEDGILSAVAVAKHLGVSTPWKI